MTDSDAKNKVFEILDTVGWLGKRRGRTALCSPLNPQDGKEGPGMLSVPVKRSRQL